VAPKQPGDPLRPITAALGVWSALYVVPHLYWAGGGDLGFSALKPSATAHDAWQAINAAASVILLMPVAIALALPRASLQRRTRALLLAACLVGASIATSHGAYGVVYRVLNVAGIVDVDGERFTPTQHPWVVWDLFIFEPWFIIEGVLLASTGWVAMPDHRSRRRWLLGCFVGGLLALTSGTLGLRAG
jgi:hypothetical protein